MLERILFFSRFLAIFLLFWALNIFAVENNDTLKTEENLSDFDFVINAIRVEGVFRITEGTLFNYLPIQPGETFNVNKLTLSLKNLYQSGLFRDIQIKRENRDLVVVVKERPAIESFNIKGNKEIKTEDLKKVLNQAGLTEGRLFNQLILDQLTQELVQQYHSRGRYSVVVKTEVSELNNNQIKIDVNIDEGEVAKIRQINIVGNYDYPDEKILENLELTTPDLISSISSRDRYAREKLNGDLEKIRTFYMDKGYADFKLESVVVSISTDKNGVFITLNIHEGKRYKVSKTNLVGNIPSSVSNLADFLTIENGEYFSLTLMKSSIELMKQRLGAEGFAFSEINPYPEINEETQTVIVNFYVDPGERVYVRRVIIKSEGSTLDTVFRREIRQLEGTWLSNYLVDRSKLRLSRLPFVENVEQKIEKVAGKNDQVDVYFEIKERSAGDFNASVGYGGTTLGGSINLAVNHSNFLGTGNRVSLAISQLSYARVFSASFSEPYWLINGVSRTVSAYYQSSDSLGSNLEALTRENYGLGLNFRVPISEFSFVSFGSNFSKSDTSIYGINSSPNTFAFISNPNHGKLSLQNFGYGQISYAIKYNTLTFNLGIGSDTRNRTIFADRGYLRQLALEIATYPGDVSWYTINFNQIQYFPLFKGITFGTASDLSYIGVYGNTYTAPPEKRFFAGGANSLRGFKDSYLGPQYLRNNTLIPVGGDFRVYSQNELLIPNYFSDDPYAPPKNGRAGWFFDVGMVYPEIKDFSFSQLRASTGLSLTLITPVGALRFSYAIPLRYQTSDYLERFQFSIGTLF